MIPFNREQVLGVLYVLVSGFILFTTLSATAGQVVPSQPSESKNSSDGLLPAKADDIEVSITMKPDTVTMGDPIVVSLSVTHPAEVLVSVPLHSAPKRFELLSSEHTAENLGDGRVRESYQLNFAIYYLGRFEFAPLDIGFVRQDGSSGSILTETAQVKVVSVILDAKDNTLREVGLPVSILEDDYTLAVVGSSLLLAVVLSLIFLLGYRHYESRKPPPPPPPPRPAHEIALEKFQVLEERDLLAIDESKQFYFVVSEIMREYFGNRYNFESLEMSSSELFRALKPLRWPKGISWNSVKNFLTDCDMVKFAKYEPIEEECHKILRESYSIINLTKLEIVELGREEKELSVKA